MFGSDGKCSILQIYTCKPELQLKYGIMIMHEINVIIVYF